MAVLVSHLQKYSMKLYQERRRFAMTPKEATALDIYLTTPAEKFYAETNEEDETENWNKDDRMATVEENDWVFIVFYKKTPVETFNTLTERYDKYVLTQESFLQLLDERGPDGLAVEKTNIISGKEWLKTR